ncbi:DNA-directed RNA polymerase I subunit [Martiniozyma asiatica (nom. inval.)]|nr:DNA-directed RNA polymerase I subunit [Martiniozyma asiatica]
MVKRRFSDSGDVVVVDDSNKKSKASSQLSKINPETGLSQCFHFVKTKLYVSLSPQFINDPIKGIKTQHLNGSIMRYNQKLRGVVVGYRNITLADENKSFEEQENGERKEIILAKVSDENPYTFFWVYVDFIVWSPKIGDILEGNVTIQSKTHISLLINDVFNATIKGRFIPEEWTFSEAADNEELNQGTWMDESGLLIGGKLKLEVIYTNTGSRNFDIIVQWADRQPPNDEQPVSMSLDFGEMSNGNFSKHKTFGDDDDDYNNNDNDNTNMENINITVDGDKVESEESEEAVAYNESENEDGLQYNNGSDEDDEDEKDKDNSNSDADSDSE